MGNTPCAACPFERAFGAVSVRARYARRGTNGFDREAAACYIVY
jgi:hypothetical protein